MKRDDTTGLAGGGNKTRKLEFLVADALAQGADTLVTCGAPQSNHCRLTLAAANVEGLACRLVLERYADRDYDPDASGNTFLFRLLGVEERVVVAPGADLDVAMDQVLADLAAEGRKGYAIPTGGSNALGALGYVACAQELVAQAFDLGVDFKAVVVCSGSAGTHAGLVVGMQGSRAGIPVHGISNGRACDVQVPLVHDLANGCAQLLGVAPIGLDDVIVDDTQTGPGYAVPTDGMVEAVQLLARTEGILLDPVYTGKTMAGLIHRVRTGVYGPEDDVVFVHTGGGPSLFAFQQDVLP
jgi:D-cysteine desulfhydrase